MPHLNYYYTPEPPAQDTAAGHQRRAALAVRRRARRRFFLVLGLIFLLALGVFTLRWWELSHPAASPQPSPVATPTQEDISPPMAATGDGTVLTISGLSDDPIPLSYQDIYAKNIPSVVFITGYGLDSGAMGTGVVLSEDGYIITNAHVIEDCYQIIITLSDGTDYTAALVGSDVSSDLAVLKVDAQGLTPAEFGDSDLLQVGDVALAIGNPLGLELRGTMTDGIISAINRDLTVDGKSMLLLQTTAALNSGNSGGALINGYGQVVGITTLKMSSTYSSVEGLGFAIPTQSAKLIVDALIADGVVSNRTTIGVIVRNMYLDELAESGTDYGILVIEVEEKSDAAAQGLVPGDVIVACDGMEIQSTDDLMTARDAHAPGDTIAFTIVREGETMTLSIMLMDQYQLD